MSAQEREALPIGTPVIAFPGTRDGRALLTRTRSEVWRTDAGDEVVAVEGYAGGIALTHIEVIPASLVSPVPAGGEVEAATEDALARAVMGVLQCDVMPACREDCGMDCDGDHEERECYEHEDPERIPFTGDVCWLAQSVVDAIRPLLAGGVPGRSEAEIKGEALREAADELEASQQLAVDFHGNRFAVCGTPWLRDRAARVAGTTEAGDEPLGEFYVDELPGAEAGDDRG